MEVLSLERADGVEGVEAEDDGADDAAEWNGAEAVAGVPRVGALTVVARNEEFAFRYYGIDFARSMCLRAVGVGSAPKFVIDRAVIPVVLFVVPLIDFENAVFHGDTFARESDDALDDVLVFNIGWNGASYWVLDASGLVGANSLLVFIHKDDNLTTLGNIFVAGEVRPRDGSAINDDTVVVFQGVFHTATHDIVGTVNISIEKKRTEHNDDYEAGKAKQIFK